MGSTKHPTSLVPFRHSSPFPPSKLFGEQVNESQQDQVSQQESTKSTRVNKSQRESTKVNKSQQSQRESTRVQKSQQESTKVSKSQQRSSANKRALVNEMLVNEVYPCAEHYEVEEEGDVDTINVANWAAWQSYS